MPNVFVPVTVFINKSKIQFESYSQQYVDAITRLKWCLSISQRYNLKAIHNKVGDTPKNSKGVYQ